jgi:hypothetical protein
MALSPWRLCQLRGPGTVAKGQGEIVATSEKEVVLSVTLVKKRWRFLNSLQTQTVHILQYVFMLPLEVVGPSQSLSALLMPRFFQRDVRGRSWKAATATAVHSCDETIAALVFGWGTPGSSDGGWVLVFDL